LAPEIPLDRLIPHFWRQKYLSTALLTLLASTLLLAACGGNPPQIVDYGPPRGAIDISTMAPIRVTFDHAVDQPSVESRIHLLPVTTGNVRWLSNRQLVFQHETLRTLTTYEVVIEPGYKDLAGNTYSLRHHWLFTTEGPPTLAGSTPANAESGVDPAAYLAINFSRTMNLASMKSALAITPAVPFNVRLDPTDNRRAIIAPSQLLTPNTTYDIGVFAAARDVEGNQLDRDYTITFKTGAIRPLHGWVTFSTTPSTFGSAGGLWIVNESGFPRQLFDTPAVTSFAWSPSGDSLLAQLDGKTWLRFAPGGGPTTLTFKGTWAAPLASGMGVVYIDGNGALRLQTPDGRDQQIADDVVEAAVTPNGLRLAYVHGATDPNQVWGYDVGLKASYLLASDSARVSNVTWAPNGTRIAYLRHEIGNVALRVRNLTGTAATSTAASAPDIGAPAWFPDSSHLVFAAGADASAATRKAFVINALAPPATLAAASGLPTGAGIDVSSPTPSPDGHQIAFLNDKQVWLMNADGTRPTALTKPDVETFPYSCRALVWTRT
jgi:WD40 repeat protein